MKLKSLILVLALQCAWIGWTVATQESALASGRTILLETERVDPRDLLRGDFLILNYKISTVPANLFSPPANAELPQGTTIFVALKPGTNGFHAVARASAGEFAPAADEIILRGKSIWRWGNTSGSVRVEYGLEKFFVAEGTGNPRGRLTVQAAVPASGRAKIKEVFLDGKPYAEAMRDNEH
jgi:uncharacterized membrane-anchored protein